MGLDHVKVSGDFGSKLRLQGWSKLSAVAMKVSGSFPALVVFFPIKTSISGTRSDRALLVSIYMFLNL